MARPDGDGIYRDTTADNLGNNGLFTVTNRCGTIRELTRAKFLLHRENVGFVKKQFIIRFIKVDRNNENGTESLDKFEVRRPDLLTECGLPQSV